MRACVRACVCVLLSVTVSSVLSAVPRPCFPVDNTRVYVFVVVCVLASVVTCVLASVVSYVLASVVSYVLASVVSYVFVSVMSCESRHIIMYCVRDSSSLSLYSPSYSLSCYFSLSS